MDSNNAVVHTSNEGAVFSKGYSMTDIKWTLESDDIEWIMYWSKSPLKTSKGVKDEDEPVFENDMALAHLLMNEVVFVNSFHWRDDLPAEDRKNVAIFVNCSDVFAWACSDAEVLPSGQIESLYRMWKRDQSMGPAVWCAIQRNQMPQKPVEDAIRKAGIWDLDGLNLGQNTMDRSVSAAFAEISAHLRSANKATLNDTSDTRA